MTLLNIDSLTLDLANGKRLLNSISIHVAAGETVGLVGESGSGKSLTARSVLGLFPPAARLGGNVVIDGHEIVAASKNTLADVRRHSASMIFQDPRAGINPMRTIGDHMTESLRITEGVSAREAREKALELLAAVRLPRPEDHFTQYPHEFSGGMLQRVMIAGALTNSPKLLICDEPTTALDVTTQAEIIDVLLEQRDARGMGVLFITHDLNLAASMCDRVYVMTGGRVEEQGTAHQIFVSPESEYTRRLIDATPSVLVTEHDLTRASAVEGESARVTPEHPMVEVTDLVKVYRPRGREAVRAVDGVSLTIPRGGSLGVVGESGSGKSTLARMIVGLELAESGELRVDGASRLTPPKNRAERLARARTAQMVFQDPYLSLDPRIPAGQVVSDALMLHSPGLGEAEARLRAAELLQSVGLGPEHQQAKPKTLSGGQRQRVALARAIAVEPELLVLDEATSALDVSVQAQVLDLIDEVREANGLTILFITHDLGVVRRVCENTIVMQNGRVVEAGNTERLLGAPREEYTRLLIESVPIPAWER